jgi:hypothetical protein
MGRLCLVAIIPSRDKTQQSSQPQAIFMLCRRNRAKADVTEMTLAFRPPRV